MKKEVSLGKRKRTITAGASSSGGAELVGKSSMNAEDVESSLQNFPYYLSDLTNHELNASYFLHIRNKAPKNKPKGLQYRHWVLLSGPEGSEIYQETLVMSLAHRFSAKLLVLDCRPNLIEMSTHGSLTSHLKFEVKQLRRNMVMPSSVLTTDKSETPILETGAKVIYTGLKYVSKTNMASSGPTFGNRGVVQSFDTKTKKAIVTFNAPIPQGLDSNGSGDAKPDYICDATELCIDVDDQVNPPVQPFKGFNMEGRIIVFMKHAVNVMVQNSGNYFGLQPLHPLNRIPNNIFLIGSHIPQECKMQGKFDGSGPSGQPEQTFQETLTDFYNTFPYKISIQMPEDKQRFDELKSQLDRDVDLLKDRENLSQLQQVLLQQHFKCEFIETLNVKDLNLTHENSIKVVFWAMGHELSVNPPTSKSAKLVLSKESILYGLENLRAIQKNLSKSEIFPTRKGIKPENEYERRVLEDVILQSDVGIKFDDIGALDNIKDLLREIVIFPIQRPDLFCKGQLRKPCQGVLLFGPPGTGKTMLAKAVATEAHATFFNVSISNIVSKWMGDSENIVKAIFKLARRLAPSVLFIDEVDAVFGRRNMHEHDQTRRTRNEFMANWDGLLSKDTDSVLVLAATNRPYDLDEAAIRRMPRRFLVDLPDAANRSKILKVIMAEEDLSADVDFNAIAQLTDLFSGSDLKNLCRTAAYRPVREFFEKEKQDKSSAGTLAELRPLNMQDFKDARDKMRATVSSRSSIVAWLRQWNVLHGECYMAPTPSPAPAPACSPAPSPTPS